MKYLSCLFIVILVHSNSTYAAANDKAVCATSTPAFWTLNQNGCSGAFANGIRMKQIDAESVKALCDCVADGIAKKTTCDELKKYSKDKEFQKQLNAKVGRECMAKHPHKRK